MNEPCLGCNRNKDSRVDSFTRRLNEPSETLKFFNLSGLVISNALVIWYNQIFVDSLSYSI